MVIENTYIDGDGEPLSIYGANGIDSKLEDSEKYLDEIVAKFRTNGVACKRLIAHGPVVEKIIEAANTEDADLIAMTRHGWGGACPHFLRQCCRGYFKPGRSPAFYRSVAAG